MSARFFKAVRPDGMDFWTGTINYAPALGGDPITLPPVDDPHCCTGAVLHAATAAAETLLSGTWPCRLLLVEGEPVVRERHTGGFFSLRVVEEIDAHLALGPNGVQVARVIEQASSLTDDQFIALRAAWRVAYFDVNDAAREASWRRARGAARNAAWCAAGRAADRAGGSVAQEAAWATVARDLISEEHYQVLARRWESVMGPIFEEKETGQ